MILIMKKRLVCVACGSSNPTWYPPGEGIGGKHRLVCKGCGIVATGGSLDEAMSNWIGTMNEKEEMNANEDRMVR